MLGNGSGELMGRLVWLALLHATWLALAVPSSIALGFRFVPGLSRTRRYAILVVGLAIVALGPVALTARQHCVAVEPRQYREAVDIGDDQQIGRIVVIEPGAAKDAAGSVEGQASPPPSLRFFDRARNALERLSGLARSARSWGLISWAMFASVLGLWLAIGGLGVRRLLRRSQDAPVAIQARARSLAGRLGLTRVPGVRVHPDLLEPCLSGPYRQAVLLPGGWLSKASRLEVDAVLAHELAHARRRDPLVNLAQRLIETALFFHPGVLWLSKSLRIERELCTDARAVQATGDPLGLALALESVARFRRESHRNWTSRLPGVALGGDGLPLFSRIQELIGMTPTRPRPSLWPFAAIPTALVIGLTATTVGTAQDTPKPADKTVDAQAPVPPARPVEAPAPAPAPIPPVVRVFKFEEPQISYEIRLVDINHATLERLNREGAMRFQRLEGEKISESCVIDAKGLTSLVNTMIAEPSGNVVQVLRMTSREGMQGAFMVGAQQQKGRTRRLEGPGDLLALFSGKINPGSIQLSLDVETLFEGAKGPKPVTKKIATSDLIPEGSSLVINIGSQERKVGNQTVMRDKLVVVTPRRIITEAEEERISVKAPKPVEAVPAEAPAPAPIPPARPAFKAEEPQISYEVRMVGVNHSTLERLNREGATRFESLEGEKISKSCVIDAKGLMSLVNTIIAEPITDVVQLRKMTCLEGVRGAFVVNAQGAPLDSPEVRLVAPGDLHALVLGNISPGSIQLSFQVETLLEGAKGTKPVLKQVATNDLIPHDSSLVVHMGREERKVGDQTVVWDKLVTVTPRRIIPEAEEERVGEKTPKVGRFDFFKGAFW